MPYAAQLRFLQAAFRKCHIRTQVLDLYSSKAALPVPFDGIAPQAVQNVSPAYLSTLFRQETGQTLTAFVNEKRVKMAKQLLETTHLQIQTVAQHCGMPDAQYFSKIFKKYAGLTLREYRELATHT